MDSSSRSVSGGSTVNRTFTSDRKEEYRSLKCVVSDSGGVRLLSMEPVSGRSIDGVCRFSGV